MKNKKTVVIVAISIIVLASIGIFMLLSNKNGKDTKQLSDKEVLTYLEEKGFEIDSSNNTIGLYNEKDMILLFTSDKSYYFINEKISADYTNMADIMETSNNDTKLKKEVYNDFNVWLNKNNLTKSQIVSVLNYCYNLK